MKRFLIVVAMITFGLAGCKTTPTNGQTGNVAPVVDGQTNTVSTGSISDYQPQERPGYGEQQGTSTTPAQAGSYAGVSSTVFSDTSNPLSIRSIYFDFNNYSIREEYREAVAAHARFLNENPDAKMLIQGNTDVRGTREYNLVLGQRRADALRDLLLMYGAKETQIESVSLGRESPYATGNTEEAHEQNRRSDMLYRYRELQEF